jgi:nuclear pore complex protein Nup62
MEGPSELVPHDYGSHLHNFIFSLAESQPCKWQQRSFFYFLPNLVWKPSFGYQANTSAIPQRNDVSGTVETHPRTSLYPPHFFFLLSSHLLICSFVCVCVCMMLVCVYVSVCMCMCLSLCMYMYVCISLYVCACVCPYACWRSCMDVTRIVCGTQLSPPPDGL